MAGGWPGAARQTQTVCAARRSPAGSHHPNPTPSLTPTPPQPRQPHLLCHVHHFKGRAQLQQFEQHMHTTPAAADGGAKAARCSLGAGWRQPGPSAGGAMLAITGAEPAALAALAGSRQHQRSTRKPCLHPTHSLAARWGNEGTMQRSTCLAAQGRQGRAPAWRHMAASVHMPGTQLGWQVGTEARRTGGGMASLRAWQQDPPRKTT